jgi:hypothetical protein
VARLLTTVLLLLTSAPLLADTALTPHSATYKVKISVLGGELRTRLERTDSGFEATHVIQATGMSRMLAGGSIAETSRFDTASDGVKPRVYTSKDTLTRDKTNATLEFDWEAGEARGTVNGEDVVSVIDGLAHDRVSIQYEVMHDMLNGALSDKYTMFEIDRLRPVSIEIVGEKVVKVPAGEFAVIGVRHQAEGSKRATTLWCSPSLGYLPVIIEQHRKGKLRVRAALTEYVPANGG